MLELSNAVVRIHRSTAARGRAKARSHLSQDMLVVVLEGGYTHSEQMLLAAGHAKEVMQSRLAMQATTEPALRRAVEEILKRPVRSFMSAHDPECGRSGGGLPAGGVERGKRSSVPPLFARYGARVPASRWLRYPDAHQPEPILAAVIERGATDGELAAFRRAAHSLADGLADQLAALPARSGLAAASRMSCGPSSWGLPLPQHGAALEGARRDGAARRRALPDGQRPSSLLRLGEPTAVARGGDRLRSQRPR